MWKTQCLKYPSNMFNSLRIMLNKVVVDDSGAFLYLYMLR